MTATVKSVHAQWLAKLRRLHPAIGRGACRGSAPHKPLLLLSLLDQIEGGELAERRFARSPGLVLRFRTYGSLVNERWPTRLDIRMPLYYLRSQSFWTAHQEDQSPAHSPESCFACEMTESFFEAALDPGFRLDARLLLIATYFTPAEQIALLESMRLGKYRDERHPDRTRVIEEAEKAAVKNGRSARFAVQVVAGYHYTCALTGLRCMTTDGATIVDAAHIDPWSRSRNDNPTNGLALCKNAHWSFDQGLWSVNQDGKIIIATAARFLESSPTAALLLQTYAGNLLSYAPRTTLRPNHDNFKSHRKHHGLEL